MHRLAKLELASDSRERRQCLDTARELDELLVALDPGSTVQRQLDTAYCGMRTTQLLAGHEVDDDDDAIRRLGLWTILQIKWPRLTEHLTQQPRDLENLQNGITAEQIKDDLAPVFMDPVAQRVANGIRDVKLRPADIVKFTAPWRLPQERHEPSHRDERSTAAAAPVVPRRIPT